MGQKHKAKYKHPLAAALQFDMDDLDANRHGIMTEHQVRRLRRQFITKMGYFMVFGPLVLGVLIVMTGTLLTENIAICILPALLLGLATFTSVVTRLIGVFRDMNERVVANVEGYIRLDLFRTLFSARPNYTVLTGEERFEIDKATFLTFKNHEPYILYYTPRTKILLSAEWLNDDPFLPQ